MIRRLIAALAVCAGFGLAGAALAQKTAPAPAPAPAATSAPVVAVQALPAAIGPFSRFGQVTDYEALPNGAGLGASVEYRDAADGAIATVYIYTARMSGLRDGADAPEVQAQLQAAGRDIYAAGPRRGYELMGEGAMRPVTGRNDQPAMRCTHFMLRRQSGGELDSYACVGVLNGRFLKLRLTFGGGAQARSEDRALAFGRGVVAALGG